MSNDPFELDDFWKMNMEELTLWLSRYGVDGPLEGPKAKYARLVHGVRTQLLPAEQLVQATRDAAESAERAAKLAAAAAIVLAIMSVIELFRSIAT